MSPLRTRQVSTISSCMHLTHPSAGLVVVEVHEVPDVPLLPHDAPVRGVDKLASKPHPVLQVIAVN